MARCKPGATNATFGNGANILVQTGGAVIDTNGNSITMNAMLTPDPKSPGGGLTKLGDGTLILTNSCTYSGGTVVEDARADRSLRRRFA